jgi:hypothetical protein
MARRSVSARRCQVERPEERSAPCRAALPNQRSRSHRRETEATRSSPQAGRQSGRHPQEPATKGRCAPRTASPNASAQLPVRGAAAGTISRRPPEEDWRSHGPSICRNGEALDAHARALYGVAVPGGRRSSAGRPFVATQVCRTRACRSAGDHAEGKRLAESGGEAGVAPIPDPLSSEPDPARRPARPTARTPRRRASAPG